MFSFLLSASLSRCVNPILLSPLNTIIGKVNYNKPEREHKKPNKVIAEFVGEICISKKTLKLFTSFYLFG